MGFPHGGGPVSRKSPCPMPQSQIHLAQTLPPLRHDTTAAEHTADTVGSYLIGAGVISAYTLLWARGLARRRALSVEEILLAYGYVPAETLAQAYGAVYRAQVFDPSSYRGDPRLLDQIGTVRAFTIGVLPVRRVGRGVLIAVANPEVFQRHRQELENIYGEIYLVFATRQQITDEIIRLRPNPLATRAETRLPEENSCRSMTAIPIAMALILTALAIGFYQAPQPMIFWATMVAVGILLIWCTLKGTSAILLLFRLGREKQQEEEEAPAQFLRKPVVTLLVPLYRETGVVVQLISRLRALRYPVELLDVILILEEDDEKMAAFLRHTPLPPWIRTLIVPSGNVQTKPRAMNLALDIARGSIVGVYDAEDAPDPDQIHRVVDHFAASPPEVACLQGRLDYYRPRKNWLSRCFCLEYATWFGVVLEGLQALQLTIPLGGTTVFFRREILEELGGWDAHNVTEDADLGVRLVRQGYRTELVDTVTLEEPNCRARAWIKQRSRWLKGYILTYALHIRNPRQLWRDLGPRGFFGVQILFLGSFLGFCLAPFLWVFLFVPYGLPHPIVDVFGSNGSKVFMLLFLLSEYLMIMVTILAAKLRGYTRLGIWALSMQLYYPLATIAGYKALIECLYKPFFWDKTEHGLIGVATTSQKRHRKIAIKGQAMAA